MSIVRLLDGTQAASDSEAWRHECEARHIAALPTLPQRREWLEAVQHRRGKAAADVLRRTIKAIWEGGR